MTKFQFSEIAGHFIVGMTTIFILKSLKVKTSPALMAGVIMPIVHAKFDSPVGKIIYRQL